MRHLEPKIQKLNDLLRIELGTVPNGQGQHQWRYTGDLVALFVLYDEHDRPVIEYKATDGGVLVAAYKTFKALQRIDKPRNWALCTWEDPGAEAEWRRKFGTTETYPGAESYIAGADQLILDEGFEPTLELTRSFIDQIRRVRKLSTEDRIAHFDKIDAASDKAVEDKATGIIDPDVPRFGVIPGKRGGSVSFGGVEEPKKELAGV